MYSRLGKSTSAQDRVTPQRQVVDSEQRIRGPFRPDLLTLARQSRSLTQTDLARLSGLSQSTISRLEEQASPTDSQLNRLSDALDYPNTFFFQTDLIYGFGVGELFHRRRKTIPAKTLEAVHAEMNIRCMVLRRLIK